MESAGKPAEVPASGVPAAQEATNEAAAIGVLSTQTIGVKDEMKKILCGPAASTETPPPAPAAAEGENPAAQAGHEGGRRSRRRRQKKSAKKSKKSKKGGRSRKNCGSKNRRKHSRRR